MGIDNEDEFGPDLSIDGNDVDWQSTAETLQEEVTSLSALDKALTTKFDPPLTEAQAKQVNDLVATVIKGERDGTNAGANKVYPFEDGEFLILGPEIFTKIEDQSAIMYKGVAYGLKKGIDLQPKDLKAYANGENVEVQKFGNWVPGLITSKQNGLLNVDTEVGPVTVGSYHIIRKVSKDA